MLPVTCGVASCHVGGFPQQGGRSRFSGSSVHVKGGRRSRSGGFCGEPLFLQISVVMGVCVECGFGRSELSWAVVGEKSCDSSYEVVHSPFTPSSPSRPRVVNREE